MRSHIPGPLGAADPTYKLPFSKRYSLLKPSQCAYNNCTTYSSIKLRSSDGFGNFWLAIYALAWFTISGVIL